MKKPEIVIGAAEQALVELNPYIPGGVKFEPHVRFVSLPSDLLLIEHLSSINLNELVAFKGVVTRRADVMHKVKMAVYGCAMCNTEIRLPVDRAFVPPRKCDECKKFGTMRQLEEKSSFTDIQRAEVQELLERVRGGAPAAHVELLLEDDSVNCIAPGDNVDIIGTMRLKQPIKTRQKQELVYSRYIEVNSAQSLKRDFEEIEITKDDEARIRELSKDPRIGEYLIKSIAPSIYGHDEVKRALALQLFGGTKGKTMKGGASIRDDIHILLIGDPGLAKSRFLLSVNDLAPKSIYVSGKSVSGAGLTVSAEKDELGEGGWTLKAGAIVLASGGSVQIDEFDKIAEEDRAALHEALETQTVSVAKAGIVAKFRAKTSVLAAANPKYGRFDQTKNLAEQFDVPPTLLSRFDLIFPIVDVLDEEKDTKLAEHILSTHRGDEKQETDYMMIEKEILRKYIAYARRSIFPKLTKEASDKIREFYVELRSRGRDVGSVAITPRYLEGLVRLAEANAKIRLSDVVDAEDAEVAVNLFNYVMRQIMVDRETGMLDVDVVTTGKPKSTRDKMQKVDTIREIVKEHLKHEDSAAVEDIISDAASYEIDEMEARKIIAELLRRGELYEKEHGHVRLVR
ncbi:minichromosome maintenance protein MCM [Candidatus Micrarchaeota archaeon]|nr:minichromosome maintenance protein MCM [Candidatus Micrarchaeota archaeon]